MDYRAIATQIAQREGVPVDLFLRMIGQESAWNAGALSPKGASGLAQLMPGTARDLGVDPNDPIQNMTGGARYLRQQLDTFGRPDLALAAYNAGPGAVKKHGGIPPYRETQDYVRKILGDNEGQAVADDAMTALGLKPQGVLTSKNTESKPMIAEQPQARGLLDSLGIQKMQEGAAGETGQRFYERDTFKDTAASLAQGFAAMGSMPALQKMTADISSQRTEQKARNKTVEYLRANGRDDLADMVEKGLIGGKEAAGVLLQQPKEKFRQVSGADIGLTGDDANKQFNLAPDGKITAIGGNAPVTNIGAKVDETAWQKGMGEYGVKTFAAIQNEALSAQDMLSNTIVLENLMQDPNFTSGALVEPKMAYRKVIETLGGEAADVGSLEAFRAVASKLILDQMGGSLGAGFSEGDRKFVEAMGAQLSTSIEGNKMIIQINRKIGQRKLEIAGFADKYVKEKGMIDKDFMGALREWSKANPLFESIDPNIYLGEG